MEQMYLYDVRKTEEIREVNVQTVTPSFVEDADGTKYPSTHYVWTKDRAVLEAVREVKKHHADLWSWEEEAGGVLVNFAKEGGDHRNLVTMLFEPCECNGQVSVRISC